MTDMKPFYVLPRQPYSCVKERQFFLDQGGEKEEWGKNWVLIEARSIEHARELADKIAAGMPDPQNVLEAWEADAEQFHKDTGFLRPGKDSIYSEFSYDVRLAAFEVWQNMKAKLSAAEKELECQRAWCAKYYSAKRQAQMLMAEAQKERDEMRSSLAANEKRAGELENVIKSLQHICHFLPHIVCAGCIVAPFTTTAQPRGQEELKS